MLEAPKEIEFIWLKPGCAWAEEQISHVQTWLNSEPQLTQLWVFGLRHLANSACWQDAQNAWGDFNEKRLKKVIALFDPGKANRGFPNYLLFCFQRFIWRLPKPPLRVQPSSDDGLDPIDLIPSSDSSPSELADVHDLVDRVKECVHCLRPKLREVLILHYFEEHSCLEISKLLAISVKLVHVRLCLARQILKPMLAKKVIML